RGAVRLVCPPARGPFSRGVSARPRQIRRTLLPALGGHFRACFRPRFWPLSFTCWTRYHHRRENAFCLLVFLRARVCSLPPCSSDRGPRKRQPSIGADADCSPRGGDRIFREFGGRASTATLPPRAR